MKVIQSLTLRTSVCLLVLVLGMVPVAGPAANTTFEIPVILPLTGPGAFLGSQSARTLGVLEAIVNKQGGIKGHPVKFGILDDQSNPQTAVILLNQELAKRPSLVMGGELLANCNASAGVIKADGPVLYCITSAFHPVPGGWVYASGFATTDQGLAMLRYIKLRGWKKIALISTTDASGQTLEADMMSSAALPEFQGLTVVAREHLGVTDTTADAQMARIKGAAPDVIVPMLLGTPLGNVLRSGRDQAIDLPYVVSPPNLNYKQMETYKTLIPAKDFYIIGFPGADSRTIHDRAVVRATTEFTQAVNAAGIPADVGAAIIWDSARIIVEAYRQAGTGASPAQVRKAINGVRNYSGVFGKYDFTASPQRGVLPFWNVMDRYDVGTDQFVAVSKPGDLVGK